RHGVDIEIDGIAGLAVAPGGDGERVADQQYVEIGAVNGIDGERGAVEANRPLRGDETGQVLRRAEPDAHGLAFRRDGEDFRPAIDMAGDDMAAKVITDLQRPLEIHPRAFPPAGDRRQAQGFLPGLDLEPALVRALVRQAGDGKADAAMGDGGTYVDGLWIIGGGDPEPYPLVHRRDGRDGADIGDDTCEHQ